MSHEWVEYFLVSGSAFIPANVDGVGDDTLLLLTSGERVSINMRVQTMLERIVRFFGNDLVELRRIYGQAIARTYYVPLPLTPRLTLVPFKVRRPIGRQSAHGWIVFQQCRGLRRKTRTDSFVLLTHNHEVTVLQSYKHCQQQLRHARLVQYHYHQLHQTAEVIREGPFGGHRFFEENGAPFY